jgi:hypothetical protein
MNPIIVGAVALVGWSLWGSPEWRAFKLLNPRTRHVKWLGPVKATQSEAAKIHTDMVERQWDTSYPQVTMLTWRNGRWV